MFHIYYAVGRYNDFDYVDRYDFHKCGEALTPGYAAVLMERAQNDEHLPDHVYVECRDDDFRPVYPVRPSVAAKIAAHRAATPEEIPF